MCGIAGIIGKRAKHSEPTIQKMTDSLAHRGPDGSGFWSSPAANIRFGHRRLSIIDLSKNAAQPFESTDRRFVITYNGEIYNYRELRQECEKHGSVFKSTSDTEVVLEAFRHWGTDCFRRFQGMWALALFDRDKNQVIMSRDHFGIKPLFISEHDGTIYFASEIKSFFEIGSRFTEVDEVSVHMFLSHGTIDRSEWTFFKNIKRFPQAHFASIDCDDLENFKLTRFWTPEIREVKISYDEAVQEFRRLLTKSMDLHMRSDVPVGSCLSGGLDSSSIVGLARRESAEKDFFTFTTRFPEFPQLDESAWAQKVSTRFHTQAFWAEPKIEDLKNNISDVLNTQDEPFGSLSIFSQYSVFKRIRDKGIKVVLDGQGADELLGGYHGLVPLFHLDLRKRGYKIRAAGQRLRWSMHNMKFASLIFNWKSKHSEPEPAHSVPEELIEETRYREENLFVPFEDINSYLFKMVTETNLPQLLRYEDRNSMRFSVESRVPFLHVPLVEFCFSLPSNYKYRSGWTKAILRDAMSDLLPHDVCRRRDKLGFPAPDSFWVKDLLESSDHPNGNWRTLMIELWRKNVESRRMSK